jgi:hypothetical protein
MKLVAPIKEILKYHDSKIYTLLVYKAARTDSFIPSE